jgi:RimK family alpha-L-glutamate ligase
MSRLVIFTDTPGWHGRRLRAAFAARGWDSVFLPLGSCGLELGPRGAGLRLPGCGVETPAAVFVRGVAGGTLEEVILQLNVLHALHAAGTRVYNDGRAIERSVDKGLTSFVLAAAGLPTPPTLVTAARDEAESFVAAELHAGHGVVSKPLFGSQGAGVVRLESPRAVPPPEAVNGVWYLQRFIPGAGGLPEDWRLFVVGGRTVAAVRRSGVWPANVACGGQCQAAVPNTEAAALAEAAVRALAMDYAGVDLLRDDAGRWWLIEVNSIPAWRGLEEATGIDIAGLLAADLVAAVEGYGPREAV